MISRVLHLIFVLFASLSIYGQILIEELTIDFDDSDRALVRVLNASRDCDANIGVFGIMDGAFVINDVEGATCCSNSPLQGMNDNRALLGPVVALSPYCDVSITIDVSLSATNFESCLSRDISPIGCTAFIPTFDPGGDGFQLETMLNGELILSSGYCGQQRRGIFTLNIGDIEIGDVFTFLITGGTQDEEEIYSINSIEYVGRPRSLIPAMISTVDTILCEGLDPLILTEISGGTNYQWSKDGDALSSSTFSYNSGSVVTPSDAGLYRVRVTDAGGCISIDEINVEVIPLSSKRIEPTFSNLELTYCVGDTINLPQVSDEGASGNWNLASPFIIDQVGEIDSLYFNPNDILFSSVSFPLTIQDYVREIYRDTICSGASLILEGETFDSSRLQGTYISEGGINSCDTLYEVSLVLAIVDTTQFNQSVCPGDTFIIGDERFHIGRLSDGVLVADENFCNTYVEVELSLGTVMTTIVFDPCLDAPIFENIDLKGDTTIEISGNGVSCDSIITIFYQASQSQDSLLNFILCPDDSITIEDQVFSSNNTDGTITVINAQGCPKNYIVHLEFMDEIIVPFGVDSICQGDTLVVEDELFYAGRLNGLVASNSGSCDTLYEVSLFLAVIDTSQFNEMVCPGDTFNIGGELFHMGRRIDGVHVSTDNLCDTYVAVSLSLGIIESTMNYDPCFDLPLFGNEILTQDTTYVISGNGVVCDSIINVRFQPSQFQDSLLNIILCPDDSIIIENQVFHSNNTEDTITVLNAQGCPQNYIVRLEIKEEVIVPFGIESICFGDTILVEDEMFYEDKLTGLVRRKGIGCDTLIDVNLQVRQNVEVIVQIDPCSGPSAFRQIEIREDTVIVAFGAGLECDTIYNIDYSPSLLTDSTLQIRLCVTDSILLNGTEYHASNTSGQFEILEENECRRLVNVEIQIENEVTQYLRDTLCVGADLLVGGVIFNVENPQGRIVYASNDLCDSVLLIELEFIQPIEQELTITICDNDTVLIQGQEFYNGINNVAPILFGPNGCDTILTINPIYLSSPSSTVQMTFCSDETLLVGGELFDASRTTGSVNIPLDSGCDSIVEVRLEYAYTDTIDVVRQLCIGQGVLIGGVNYDSNNPTGIATLVSNAGCDSILNINLSFGETITTKIEPLICSNEQIFIGSQFYSANNPTGIEEYVSSAGCDSLVEIELILDTVEVQIIATGTCRQSRTGRIEVTVLTQDTFEISLGGVTVGTPATSIVFEDLAIGEYSVVVESERSCFFVYPTLVEATFANEVSYTLEDNSADFYDVSVNISGPFQDIIWEPSPDLSCIDCLTPTIRKGGSGEYRAVVQDLNGCIAIVVVSIDEESQVFFYLPNVISSSGDIDNSSFYLHSTEEGIFNYDMAIFDRWGQPMFDKTQILPNDANMGWRGFKNGTKVVSGVYIYSILVRLEDGSEESRLGELLVIE